MKKRLLVMGPLPGPLLATVCLRLDCEQAAERAPLLQALTPGLVPAAIATRRALDTHSPSAGVEA